MFMRNSFGCFMTVSFAASSVESNISEFDPAEGKTRLHRIRTAERNGVETIGSLKAMAAGVTRDSFFRRMGIAACDIELLVQLAELVLLVIVLSPHHIHLLDCCTHVRSCQRQTATVGTAPVGT